MGMNYFNDSMKSMNFTNVGNGHRTRINKGVLKMKNYSVISKLAVVMMSLVAFKAQAQTVFDLNLRAQSGAQCEPGNPNASNQFVCCVQLAKSMELDSQNVLHLKADPSLCSDSSLQDLQFSLKTARPDGINVYELSSPQIENTPFKSYAGKTATFWVAVNSYFSFPQDIYTKNDGVHPFISAPLQIEHSSGTEKKVAFRAELSSQLGWKYLSQKTLSERSETYSCSNPSDRNAMCIRTIRTVEQSWLNQLTGDVEQVVREFRL